MFYVICQNVFFCRLPIDDNVKMTAGQYRDRLYQEITSKRRDARKKEGTGEVSGKGGSSSSSSSASASSKTK